MLVEDEVVRIEELSSRRVIKFKLIAGIVTADGYAAEGCRMEGKTVSFSIT